MNPKTLVRRYCERLPPALVPAPGELVTYCVSSPGFVKVGRTDDLALRLRRLQTGNPLQLWIFGFVRRDLERRAHSLLRAAGVARGESREWFEDVPKCRRVLAGLDLLWAYPVGDVRRAHERRRLDGGLLDQAAEWLADALADGPLRFRLLLSMGEPRGYSETVIRAAGARVGAWRRLDEWQLKPPEGFDARTP